ncbi:sugar transferase [Bacillus thuringiensis]|nr:sugar transferase [Bacillus thuringiensis]
MKVIIKLVANLLRNIIDCIISIVCLIITSPIMLIICFFIKLVDSGPVLFVQKRTGKNGRQFNIYKFRTMNKKKHRENFNLGWKDGVPDGFVFKKNDEFNPRITKIGKILRKTSLDELPQFFNVLKGDMSIVGPRPEIPEITRYYTEEQKERLKVKPGITGWAQIHGRSEMNYGMKLELDKFYVNNHSLLLDIYIIIKTIKVVLTTKGAV